MHDLNVLTGGEQFAAKWIILADDDKDDVELFCEVLKDINANMKFIVAENGDVLMNLLSGLTDLPDLIFLDINMPRKNGFQCLQEIKSHPTLKNIKVVILSTASSASVIHLAYEKGADFYVVKSAHYHRFCQTIKMCMQFDWESIRHNL